MKAHCWVDDANMAALTDLYQLTMLQAYFREGMDDVAVFDLFVRRLSERNFLLACGLDTALHYLEILCFSPEIRTYLATLGLFAPDFLDFLGGFRFTGSVFAVREGTPVFAGEPILEVVAPIGQAQVVESFLLNQVTFQTGIASKAARVVYAAGGRTVVDFGMRRMHGADAPIKAARAYHIAGVGATSNVLAGQVYGLPVTGTMAHSYVEAHDDEEAAFRAFIDTYPETTLLVDTNDTLEGVRKVIRMAERMGTDFRVQAVRLDSGDLVALSRQARALLDAAGLHTVRIFASNSLDEYVIADLLRRGAPIDGFGVGTRMGTMADHPYLDSAYKLCAYGGRSRMKWAEDKSNLPGRKQLYRTFHAGHAVGDVIALADEPHDGQPLLECVMRHGRRTDAGRRALDEARDHARSSLATLPEPLLSRDEAEPPYPVSLSVGLQAEINACRAGRWKGVAGR